MEVGAGHDAGWHGGLPLRRSVSGRRLAAALPPGDYIVEIDGNKLPFPATEGEVFEVKPQMRPATKPTRDKPRGAVEALHLRADSHLFLDKELFPEQ